MRIVAASDSSVIVIFGDAITRDFHIRVVDLFYKVRALNDPSIRNLHPAYASLSVDFDPLRCGHEEIVRVLQQLAGADAEERVVEQRCVEIPVCYEDEFALDLPGVAAQVGLSREEVVRTHSSGSYFVSFLGFSPGFAYLGGLPGKLFVPRLSTPRRAVAAGSVGIAGTQTGVYPVESPGGWQLIGRTPLCMFDPEVDPPTRLQLGDTVRFVPISRTRFEEMGRSITGMSEEKG